MDRILIVSPTLGLGGAEKVAALLINSMAKRNELEVHVVIYDEIIDYQIRENVKIHSLSQGINKKSIFDRLYSVYNKIKKLKVIINKVSPCKIISISTNANIITLLATPKSTPVVISHQVVPVSDEGVFNFVVEKFLIKHIYSKAHKIITPSLGVKEQLLRINTNLNITVVFNPIDVEGIPGLIKENIDLTMYGSYIIGVGRLHKQKGFDLLLESFSILKDKNLNLLLLGDGDEKDSLVKLAISLGIKDRVFFVPFHKNPYIFMNRSECFVLSSRWEGFGLVVAEALASLAKVVSFDCPSGPAEILNNGEYGYLVRGTNISELADSIEKAIETKNIKSDRLDEQLTLFSPDFVLEKYLENSSS